MSNWKPQQVTNHLWRNQQHEQGNHDSNQQNHNSSRQYFLEERINPLKTEVFFCHQNQNANIGNFTTVLKPHNISTHLKGTETSFQVVPLFSKSIHFWASYITFWNFLKIPSVFKGENKLDICEWDLTTYTCIQEFLMYQIDTCSFHFELNYCMKLYMILVRYMYYVPVIGNCKIFWCKGCIISLELWCNGVIRLRSVFWCSLCWIEWHY
jgi:hypothetical protein